ncbi:hypothetical protein LSH36_1306g00001, partial [Paralvinella palmiformis]
MLCHACENYLTVPLHLFNNPGTHFGNRSFHYLCPSPNTLNIYTYKISKDQYNY